MLKFPPPQASPSQLSFQLSMSGKLTQLLWLTDLGHYICGDLCATVLSIIKLHFIQQPKVAPLQPPFLAFVACHISFHCSMRPI